MLDSICGVCVAMPGATFATLWQHELGRRNRAWGRKSQSKSRLGRFHDTPPCTSRIHPTSTITAAASEPLEKRDRVVHLLSGQWPFVHLDLSLTAEEGGQKRIVGRTKSERLSDKKPRYFCDAASGRVSSTKQLSHRREKPP